MAISEKIELLGKGCYKGKNIPDVLTLKAIPTSSELDYVSSEDFDETMLKTILPKSVEENINFYNLLEIDYQWILRCLRILNYGPYHTTNMIFCNNCGPCYGDYKVDLQSINCITLPKGFTGSTVVKKEEFIQYDKDVKIDMLTIRDALNAEKDTQFNINGGDKIDRPFARLCYMIKSFGSDTGLTPIETRLRIESDFISPDFMILKDVANELTDYGLRAGGETVCPKCGKKGASFVALVDDRYFRPTLGDLRAWKADRDRRKDDDTVTSATKGV